MKIKKNVSVLFSVALFCGMAATGSVINEASALEIGDVMEIAVPAIAAMPATLATLATPAVEAVEGDIISGTVVDPTLAKFGEEIKERTATQADVDAGVRLGNDSLGDKVKLGETIVLRDASDADVAAGVVLDSTLVELDDMFTGKGTYEQYILTGFDVDGNGVITGLEGNLTPNRVANQDDIDANVYTNGIVVKVGDPIFTRIATDTDVANELMVNETIALEGQQIGVRIATDTDINADVTILEDGEWRVVNEDDEIPARLATAADVEAEARIDPTLVAAGDSVYTGYADEDDVTNKKTTGNVLVVDGDIILSRKATVEDIDAGVATGGTLTAINDLIPGAIVVTAADVEAGLKVKGIAVEAGKIIFLAKDAAEATPATEATIAKDAVIATADDVFEWVISDVSEADKTEINGMSQNLTGMEKLTALSSILEKNDAAIAAGVSVSDKDFSTLSRTAFGLVPDVKAYNEYNEAVDGLIAGTVTIDEIRTKINPDVSSGTGSVITGISAVSNSIGNHQMNLIASSGKYGTKKHLAALDTGKNSGGSNMNASTWMEAFISDSTMDTRDSVAGYNASTHGATFGIDTILANDSILGFAFSYANIDVDGKSTVNSQTDTDQFQGTLYGSIMQDVFFLNGSLSYAHSESDTSRDTFGGKATGSYGTDIYSVELGAGMPIVNDDMTVTPQTTMRYSAISTDSYTESGSGALDVAVEDMNMLTIKTGVSFENKIKLSDASLIPKMRLLVDWDILREKAVSTASWVSTGATIVSIDGPKPAAFGGSVGVGFDYATNDGLYVVSLDYDMSAKPDFILHAGTAKFRMNF